MTWRLAKSLETLRSQVNALYPSRSKDSDGSIGDVSHSARTSDHNPNDAGVVCAIDITHDPKSGCDSYALAEVLRASRDPRIKYIISNRKICSSDTQPWAWRKYTGKNPHDHHVHVSVKSPGKFYDDTAPWNLTAQPMPAPVATAPAPPKTLRAGDTGPAVADLQVALKVKPDGVFGADTLTAVKAFQKAHKLVADGVVGPQTWAALKA